MSLNLHDAMVNGSKYLQSPIDDIESFFWLACWGVLFNTHTSNQARSNVESKWQGYLASAQYSSKTSLVRELRRQISTKGFSPISTQLLPLLKDWWTAQERLDLRWAEMLASAEDMPQSDERNVFYLKKFHLFALFGVKEFLSLAQRHISTLQTYKPFEPSQ